MSSAFAGRHFDIHGGRTCGFPITERNRPIRGGSTAAFVNYWMRNGPSGGQRKDVRVPGQFLHHREVLKAYDAGWCASSSCAPITAAR